MDRIRDDITAKYDLPPIEQYGHSKEDYYRTFLIQTDHIPLKLIEARELGNGIDANYVDILEARAFCRTKINQIEEENQNGTSNCIS